MTGADYRRLTTKLDNDTGPMQAGSTFFGKAACWPNG